MWCFPFAELFVNDSTSTSAFYVTSWLADPAWSRHPRSDLGEDVWWLSWNPTRISRTFSFLIKLFNDTVDLNKDRVELDVTSIRQNQDAKITTPKANKAKQTEGPKKAKIILRAK